MEQGGGRSVVPEAEQPRASVVIPVYNEAENIVPCLDRILDLVTIPVEILCVYDRPDDTTAPVLDEYHELDGRVRGVLNQIGPGPAAAIRAGFDAAMADTVVVTMADGSDDPAIIEGLVRLIERGCVIACASRYMPGGAQVGGAVLKSGLSKWAGRSLYWFGRVGTRDATNSYKAYRRSWVQAVGIESVGGFECGIELVAKARRQRQFVAELPTIWLDREFGSSRFQLLKWLPSYLHWYRYAFGPRIDPPEAKAAAGSDDPDLRS